ncbi:MAG: nucleotidyltransferase domain-containing protein [Thermoproteota archaeon]
MEAKSSAKEYLECCFNVIEEEIKKIKERKEVKSVIVFGSAVRPEDFVIGLSDIDILVVTTKECDEGHYSLKVCESEVSIVVMSIGEVKKIFEVGDPLSFILHKEGKILEGDSEVSSIIANNPRTTEYTLKFLRNSTFVALELSIESYFHENYRKAVSHAYHAIRHLARYNALKRDLDFPISNEEVKKVLEGQTKDLFIKLALARKACVDKESCKEMLEEAIEAIALELSLKYPSLSFMERKIGGKPMTVVVKEIKDSIVVRVEVMSNEGELKKFEFEREQMREIEEMFDFP